jgi:multidrug efflux pump subunit AcrA (membrane-fusion protein)
MTDPTHPPEGEPLIRAIAMPADAKPFVGTVTRFSLRLNPETRNMRTEIDLPNPEERLYPGMYAEVSLEMNRRPDALTIPATAVGSDGVANFVYTITDNRISRLAINIGLTDSGRTEVTGGLSKETSVVTTFRGAPPPGTPVQPPAVREKS